MQQMGYNYEYFASSILENEEYIEFKDGQINPDTMGYKAVILYQEQISLSSAKKLLEFTQQGLPVVFVNGLSEVIECQSDTVYNTWQHGEAASKSMYSYDSDEEVQAVVAQIKALPNSRTVTASENGIDNDAYLALQELGVYPRAAFDETNHNIVTTMRETNDEVYLYAYNHRWDQQEAYEVEITLDMPTSKENINVGPISDLISWKDIPELGEYVSGIGYYETTFTLPDNWNSSNGAYLDIESISGQTGAVYVNGQKVSVLNPRDTVADITDFLSPGENTIKVEVTSILMNALRDLYRPGGLYEEHTTNDRYPGWTGNADSENNQSRDFGMTGNVVLKTYTKSVTVEVNKDILNSVITYAENAKSSGEYDNAIVS